MPATPNPGLLERDRSPRLPTAGSSISPTHRFVASKEVVPLTTIARARPGVHKRVPCSNLARTESGPRSLSRLAFRLGEETPRPLARHLSPAVCGLRHSPARVQGPSDFPVVLRPPRPEGELASSRMASLSRHIAAGQPLSSLYSRGPRRKNLPTLCGATSRPPSHRPWLARVPGRVRGPSGPSLPRAGATLR